MGRTGWVFADSPNVTLEINPSKESGSLSVIKDIGYSVTAGPDGRTLIFEQGTQLPEVSFTGFFYHEHQYDVFVSEVEKDISVLTDDRGVTYNVVWQSFTLERAGTIKYPWKHTYTLSGLVKSYTIP